MRTVRESSRRDRIARVSQPYYSSAPSASARVYVGNLPWEVSWQDLKDHMKSAGRVLRADILQDSQTGRSKGCGIVEFSSAREADEAIRSLHDSELRGRKIFVREDRVNNNSNSDPPAHAMHAYPPMHMYRDAPPVYASYRDREPLPPRRAMDPAPMPTRPSGPSGVVVDGLPAGLDWRVLKDHFKPAGFVVRADIVTDGLGVVDFQSAQDARQAVDQLDRTRIGENVISVRLRGTVEHDQRRRHEDEDNNNDNMESERERARGRERDEDEEGDEGYRRVARYVYRDEEDRERDGGRERERERERGPPAEFQGERKLYVGQLAWSVNWQRLKDHFKQIGNVVRADVVTEPNSNRSRGFGFVEFATAEEARRALEELDGSMLEGRKIYVKEDVRDR